MAEKNDQKSKAPERISENFDRNNFERLEAMRSAQPHGGPSTERNANSVWFVVGKERIPR